MRKQTNDGTVFCESVVSYMASLISKRDFAGAIGHFEANRSLVQETGGCWAADMLHKVSLAHASLTHYTDALKTIRVAQELAESARDSLQLAEIFITLGNILRDSGEPTEAEKAYRDAESIFRRNDNPEGQSRALNQLAGLFFRLTDYRNALPILMEAVTIAKRLDDSQKLAFMMGNIGRLQTFMGDFTEAEKHLSINVEISTKLNDDMEIARARLSLGYLYIQQGLFSQAEEELNLAYPLISSLKMCREEVIYLTYLGELCYRSDKLEESEQILKKALSLAQEAAPEGSLAGRVLRHFAALKLLQGEIRTARKSAYRASCIMKRTGDDVEVGAINLILGKVAEAEGKADNALSLYRLAIDQLGETGVRFEKAEALLAAGSSNLFSPRQRLTYLFRAEEFYAKSGLSKHLKKVGNLISQVDPLQETNQGQANNMVLSKEVDYLTRCPAILKIKSQLKLLKRSDLPVLITGETGVGKDHLARYFHFLVRPDSPYVAVNCASLPENLLESELFGYRKGAFTGADGDKQGLLEAASGGVFLLDEIGDMPLNLQAKLLGVLENRCLTPLGSTNDIKVDIILVAATNQNLEEMVDTGRFRRDLYYRLTGITFNLPPLRERKEDISLLLEYFLRRLNLLTDQDKLPDELVNQFLTYDWPGNIRELDNSVKRMEVISQMVVEGDLVEMARSIFAKEPPPRHSGGLFDKLEQFERQLITEALLAAQGNKSKAARMLGVHEATVRTKLKRYGISLSGGKTLIN